MNYDTTTMLANLEHTMMNGVFDTRHFFNSISTKAVNFKAFVNSIEPWFYDAAVEASEVSRRADALLLPSKLEVDYHNFDHALTVALIALWAGISYRVSHDQLIRLYVAGLYHDIGHSRGSLADVENVSIAISILSDGFNTPCTVLNNNLQVSQYAGVASLIECTQYPYAKNAEDLTISERIIRDSDICTFTREDFPTCMIGLQSELSSKMNPEQFVSENRKFLLGIKWNIPELFSRFDTLKAKKVSSITSDLWSV